MPAHVCNSESVIKFNNNNNNSLQQSVNRSPCSAFRVPRSAYYVSGTRGLKAVFFLSSVFSIIIRSRICSNTAVPLSVASTTSKL